MEIKYPKNYRFSSCFEELQKTVDIAKKMLINNQMTILFGCINIVKLDILIDKETFSSHYKELDFQKFKEIMIEEVSVIIEQNCKQPTMEEESLVEYLQNNGCNLDDANYIAEEKNKKREYIYKTLMSEETMPRYLLKENTLSDKLSKISYEINRFVFEDKSDMLYSVLEFASSENLNREVIPDRLLANKNTQKVKFVCDKYDLEYLINYLEKIKERL